MPKQNKQIVIDAIVKGIGKGKGRAQLLGTIGKKWEISRTTFDRYWKTANQQHKVSYDILKTELTIVDTNAAIKARKDGLKSKFEKQLHIQRQIEDIQNDLDAGVMPDYYMVSGVPTLYDKVMTADTKAYLRKTIKELYAELNKMEGDYAPIGVKAEVLQSMTILNFAKPPDNGGN